MKATFTLGKLAAAAVCVLGLQSSAFASAHCYCKVADSDASGNSHFTGTPLIDYGTVGGTYAGVNQQGESNQVDCQTRCRNQSNGDGNFKNAAFYCGKGLATGQTPRAFSAVGTGNYRLANTAGTIYIWNGGSCHWNPQPAPTALTYAFNAAVYTQNRAIAPNSPTVGGGAATSFSVTPALPVGLTLNGTTGVITGTPTKLQTAQSYAVTARNVVGAASKTISIQVNASPLVPTGISAAAAKPQPSSTR